MNNVTVKWLSSDQIKEKIEQFKEKYNIIDSIPVDIESIIDNKLRMDIDPRHSLQRRGFLKLDRSGILVNWDLLMNDRYENPYRFCLAHELGHYVLHDYVYEKLDFKTIDDYINFYANMSDKTYKKFEWQGNEFAGNFLVPRDNLIDEYYKLINDETDIKNELKKNASLAFFDIAIKLSKIFKVSDDVIRRRLQNESIF